MSFIFLAENLFRHSPLIARELYLVMLFLDYINLGPNRHLLGPSINLFQYYATMCYNYNSMLKSFDWSILMLFHANTDIPKALKRDCITILICCSRKKGFRHLLTFTLKALSYIDVPARLAHCKHSASIV